MRVDFAVPHNAPRPLIVGYTLLLFLDFLNPLFNAVIKSQLAGRYTEQKNVVL